jgi:hypothetical protein
MMLEWFNREYPHYRVAFITNGHQYEQVRLSHRYLTQVLQLLLRRIAEPSEPKEIPQGGTGLDQGKGVTTGDPLTDPIQPRICILVHPIPLVFYELMDACVVFLPRSSKFVAIIGSRSLASNDVAV